MEEEELRLTCVWQAPSDAQKEYQAARLASGAVLPSNIFYKDATPRVAHFLSCEIKLMGRSRLPAKPLPLELALVYDDGTPTSDADQACLRILSLSSHVKAAIPADSDAVTVSYRIELGSFRRADRSFALKIELPDAPLKVSPCVTPAVYVLSKKKLDPPRIPLGQPQPKKRRAADAFPDDDNSEDSHRVHHESSYVDPRASPPRANTDTILHRLYALESRVQELTTVIQNVLPHLPQLQSSSASHFPSSLPSSYEGLSPHHDSQPQQLPQQPQQPQSTPSSSSLRFPNDYPDHRNAMVSAH